VPGLVQGVFPSNPTALNWARTRQELPGPLRGDRVDLPALDLAGVTSRKDVRDRLTRHHDELVERHGKEERRLAYVALTRAQSVLIASGYVWDTAQRAREASPFLDGLRELAEVDEWCEPAPDETNPLTEQARSSAWPLDPLGPYPGDRGSGRRADVEAGAELVRAAAEVLPIGLGERAEQWRTDVDRLLAERARLTAGATIDVELPQLVELERDPGELARSIRRPVPRQPAPLARRGTEFHRWLEERWDAQTLLDLDQLPGAADETAADEEFEQLRQAFLHSEWATRTPSEVEVPFEMAVADDRVVRGRMDAVFGNAGDGWVVVDWKTGRKPTGTAAAAAAVQLAAYRLAWARLCNIPDDEVHRVRAAFHYVRSDETVEPGRLLDATGLRKLVAG
jgi:DNA helicase-2/ATP-dependent DNA helicase PcrA